MTTLKTASITVTALLMLSGACKAGDFTSRDDIVVTNRDAGITLAGTLCSPSAPVAAIVLATGSGAQNRDEEIAGHRPFKTIAEFLAANGYAVLRMDDRGTAGSTGDFAKAVTDDFVTDIAAALSYMDSCYSDIPLGVLGHSEGGTIAVKSAANPLCDFIITLAAPAVSGDSIIMSQTRAMLTAAGQEAAFSKMEPDLRYRYGLVKSDMPDITLRSTLFANLITTQPDVMQLPEMQKRAAAEINAMASPWYRAFMRYNPADDIATVACPWLALNGDRDMQVLPFNLETIARLNPAATTVTMPGHNHLFQQCSTGLPGEYAAISEDISQATLDEILKWLDSNIR